MPQVYESGSYEIATAYAFIGESGKAITLLNVLIAESRDYIDWAFVCSHNRLTSNRQLLSVIMVKHSVIYIVEKQISLIKFATLKYIGVES